MATNILNRIPFLQNSNRQVNQTQILSNKAVTDLQNAVQNQQLISAGFADNLGQILTSTFTVVNFNVVNFDQNSLMSLTSKLPNGNINIQAAGKYLIQCQVTSTAHMSSTEYFAVRLNYNNGASSPFGDVIYGNGAASAQYACSINCLLNANAGDSFRMEVTSTVGSNLSADTTVNYLCIERLGS